MAHKLTTCTFCGVGCGLYLETSDNKVLGAYPSVSHPTNAGRICLRGWHVHEIASSPDRLKYPLLKKNGALCQVSWEEALACIAQRLGKIRDVHGPDALAFLSSPRCSNEEAYLLQKFARSVIGTNNVHHGTGVYSNNSISVLLEMIGVSATTNSIRELDQSDLIVVDGVDLARRLVTVAGVVIRAKLKGARLIVVGTRRHRVAENADLFVQIRPNTEAMLYGAMAKVIVDRGLMNLAFLKGRCLNVEAFLENIQGYDLSEAADFCGVAAELIEAAALSYAAARSAALLFSTSMEERSKDSIRAVVNLALLTGNLGKAGAGLFALTEQNNLQGVCDMGMLPDRLPGYQQVADSKARLVFEAAWGTKIPDSPGLGARPVLKNRGGGKVRALWLGRYDPVNTAFQPDVRETLGQFEFVVAQHIFVTDSARCADVVLPTTAFGEEQVSFTNTERRIQLAEKAVEPAAGLTPAWEQIAQVARRMGADWHYNSASEIMDEIGRVVPFYSGASYDNLARDYGRQWPCTKDRPLGTQFLFAENGSHFNLIPVPKPQRGAPPSSELPLTLVFGNSLYYWNQNVLMRYSETLKREYRTLLLDYPDGFVEINQEDGKRLAIRDGQRVRLCAATTSAVATARITPEVMAGTIFVPYFMGGVERQILGACDRGGDNNLIQVRVEKEDA